MDQRHKQISKCPQRVAGSVLFLFMDIQWQLILSLCLQCYQALSTDYAGLWADSALEQLSIAMVGTGHYGGSGGLSLLVAELEGPTLYILFSIAVP